LPNSIRVSLASATARFSSARSAEKKTGSICVPVRGSTAWKVFEFSRPDPRPMIDLPDKSLFTIEGFYRALGGIGSIGRDESEALTARLVVGRERGPYL